METVEVISSLMLGLFNWCQKNKKKINSSRRKSVVLVELVVFFIFIFYFLCVKLLWICLWSRFSSNRSQVDKCQYSAAGIVPFIQNSSASRGDVSSPVSGVKYFERLYVCGRPRRSCSARRHQSLWAPAGCFSSSRPCCFTLPEPTARVKVRSRLGFDGAIRKQVAPRWRTILINTAVCSGHAY